MFRMGKEEAEAASRIIMSKSLFRIGSEYNEVENFERELKEKVGVRHCITVANGTGALAAALAALGVGPGDEVIVPAYTFIATPVAVLSVGAIPVVADINETLTLDMDDVERKLSEHTKAVIPVHIGGFPCDMDKLTDLAKKHGFFIVEDACQADGGSYKGRRLGGIGDCGAFSFNYYKIIAAGEGGAMVTNDLKTYERAIIYTDCGANFWPYKQPITEPFFSGTTMRVSEVTGAILRVQLRRLDGILADLRRVKKTIMDAVSDIPGIKCNPSNDIEGDCGLILPFLFDNITTAEKFERLTGTGRPINTDKHVYINWAPMIEKRGAHVDAMNPYLNGLNKGLQMDIQKDSCPVTLDILSRTVYFYMNCDWDESEINARVETVRNAAKQL